MKLNKLSFGITTILLLVGYGSSVYEPPSDKYPFENKMKELLGNQIKIINSLKRLRYKFHILNYLKVIIKLKVE